MEYVGIRELWKRIHKTIVSSDTSSESSGNRHVVKGGEGAGEGAEGAKGERAQNFFNLMLKKFHGNNT